MGLHFWPDSTLVYGIRVDYLSPTLYFLDLLIIVYLFLARVQKLRIWDLSASASLRIIAPLLLANLIYSVNPIATLNWTAHGIIYYLFIKSLKVDLLKKIPLVVTLGIAGQAMLAAIHVWLGRSVGGLLYYLGERELSIGQPGVALTELWGHITMRGYGTFGHPNVLAGYFVISTLVILLIKPRGAWSILAVAITTFGLLLTESRAAMLSFLGLILPTYYFVSQKSRLIYLGILLCCLLTILPALASSRHDTSLLERRTLQSTSISNIQAHPLFGTGAQASINTYPLVNPSLRLLQPDHNSVTLALSWFGLIGALVIIIYVLSTKSGIWNLASILPLAPILILDHYLLTSPQGLFIYLLFLKVVNYSHAQKHRQ